MCICHLMTGLIITFTTLCDRIRDSFLEPESLNVWGVAGRNIIAEYFSKVIAPIKMGGVSEVFLRPTWYHHSFTLIF